MKIYDQNFPAETTNFFKLEYKDHRELILVICPPWGGVNYSK